MGRGEKEHIIMSLLTVPETPCEQLAMGQGQKANTIMSNGVISDSALSSHVELAR